MPQKKTLKPGDKVSWNTSQGETHGEVVEKVTGEAHVKGHRAKASPDAPQYKVKSAKTGKEAIHKPDALDKE
jgi:plastocyanin